MAYTRFPSPVRMRASARLRTTESATRSITTMDAGVYGGDGTCFPYDVLLDILRRLPGRDAAASQCVCRLWRDVIDEHGLSLERYFPRRAFPGLFVNKIGCQSDVTFFAPPVTNGEPGFRRPVYPHEAKVRQSCNGLLLLHEWRSYYVLNPATARYARLPLPSTPCCSYGVSLAFDPAVSLHFLVFRFQKGGLLKEPLSAAQTQGEVPPLGEAQAEGVKEPKENVLPMLMYSSCRGGGRTESSCLGVVPRGTSTRRWAGRTPESYEDAFCSSDYWRGSVYMHCHNNVLVIPKGTYDMVQLPGEPCGAKSWCSFPESSVSASYERGVHYVTTNNSRLRVWMLTESTDGQLGWALAHDASLNPHGHMIRTLKIQPKVTWKIVGSRGGPVTLTVDDDEVEADRAGAYGSEYSWNSDDDNFIDVVGGADHHELGERGGYCTIMGFHPHKNALILVLNWAVVVYHLDTSRMQYLGDGNELERDHVQQACCVEDSFLHLPTLLQGRAAGREIVHATLERHRV